MGSYEQHGTTSTGSTLREPGANGAGAVDSQQADTGLTLRLLARAEQLLSISLDPAGLLDGLVRIPVPDLADLVWVRLAQGLDQDGSLLADGASPEVFALHHADAAEAVRCARIVGGAPVANDARYGSGHAVATGQPMLFPDVRQACDEGLLLEQHRQCADLLGVRSYMVVPLLGTSGPQGSMTLARTSARAPFSDRDLHSAQRLCRLAGLALENARLHRTTIRRASRVLDTAVAAFVSMGPDGSVTDWNRAAEKMFGWSRDEAIGRELAELMVPPALREDHRRAVARFLDSGVEGVAHGRPAEMPALRRDGSEFPARVSMTSLPGEDGHSFHAFIEDITDRVRALREQATRIAEMEAAQRLAGFGVWTVDLDSGDVVWSDELYRLHDLEPQSLPITLDTYYTFVHPDDHLPVQEFVQLLVAGTSDRVRYRAVTRTGRIRHLEAAAAPGGSDGEDSRVVVGFTLDVTEQKAFEARIRDFVAMASHELRTPLTSIAGFAATLSDRWTALHDDDKLGFITIIEAQADRLSRLVSDLLLLSKVENIVPSDAQVSIRHSFELALSHLALDQIGVQCDEDITACISSDHLQQVLINLLANAAKYGAGPIELSADRHDDWVTVSVSDAGDGVPDEFVPKLFETFARADESRSTSGSGLGLSIVKGIAEAYGGSAWHEHNKPRGARFCVRLPVPGQ